MNIYFEARINQFVDGVPFFVVDVDVLGSFKTGDFKQTAAGTYTLSKSLPEGTTSVTVRFTINGIGQNELKPQGQLLVSFTAPPTDTQHANPELSVQIVAG